MIAPSRAAAIDEIQARVNATLLEQGPGPWARYFLPHLVEGAFSPLHDELNAWHLRETRRPPGAKDAYAAPRGHGKACSLDTMIPTPTGWTTMADVEVGDYVLGRDGNPTRVTHKHPVLTGRDCYRVTFNDGQTVTVDAEHEWTIEPRDAKPRTLTTRQLLDVSPARRRVPVAEPLALPDALLPVGPYTLGAWLSEGARAGGLLTLNRGDSAHIGARIRAEGHDTRPVASSDRAGSVGLRAPGLTVALRALGILGTRSIPTAYLRASREQRRALLEALVDCDGHVTPAGQVEITTTASRAYAEQIAELVHTLGMRCRIYEGRATIDGRDVGPKWRVMWTPYQPVASLPRKAERVRVEGPQRARQYGRLMATIEPVESVPVQCITVDAPDHLYLIGPGMIPTHNSTAGVEVPALFHAAYCTRRFTVIASDTYAQAVDRLATVIDEVENNTKLRAAYPKLRPKVDTKGQLVRWRDDDVEFQCGCRITAVGAGKSLRGARQGAQRPDLLMLDDLEDEASVATKEALAKRLRWITRVALGLADPRKGISALWVGTILSRSALLNSATGAALDEGQERPEWARAWTPHVYSAELRGSEKRRTVVVVEEEDPGTGKARKVVKHGADGKPLTYMVGVPMWSELTRSDLARTRFTLGAVSYAAEYLSDPVDAGTALLAPPLFATYLNPNALPVARIVRLPSGRVVPVSSMTRAAALDPQYGKPGESTDPDLAAVVVAGAYGGETFLLDCWIGRDRHGQARRLVELALRWECYAAGVEAVAAQAVTADEAANDGRIPIVPLTRPGAAASTPERRTGSKVQRAMGLAVRLGDRDKPETCRVYVLPDALASSEHGTLTEHLSRFPHGRYDDPVDATVDAVELAHRATTRGETGSGPAVGGARSA